MITVYGLKNCDTCRKALKWLIAEELNHRFHDVRADGLDGPELDRWLAGTGWETLLNRRGTTWRKLPDAETTDVNATKARALMLEHPALIKRPVFEVRSDVIVGFKAEQQAALKG
ncbi:MAG: ArsC family reductase [Rhodospirillaceae bacterium]|jgi:Spx/MgsR family transcriptional regulator|nr:ArsC family reductase [Rhodospirillaceae bacterium]MBT3910072.1 ArsC family reductase [Rhodospirillaceae bacterium]MBT5299606.1 ArsC family reductase [Rhodospirillaceae bacterium]MBT5512926.1 ArsC family reductase [Rhodospirillaceae bacterium]MBT6084607.1 ArsC family reductase [Rhodospirillaceae bacterium]